MNHMPKKMIPIGIEDFEKLRNEGFYFVDKTGLIKDLLLHWGEVNLFIRPRRFGKTLNMSMLRCFFEPGTNQRIFDGLEISREQELCEKYMGKFPVISVSLKSIDAGCYQTAVAMAGKLVNAETRRHADLMESSRLTKQEKKILAALMYSEMQEPELCDSLRVLSELLRKHYGQKVVLLIDEYDVPLARAFANGYYDQMVTLIRCLFGQSLKTNPNLQFAVLTGCLRISRESIFTGLNHLRVLSVLDQQFDAYFGFTDPQVRELLEYYGQLEAYGRVKEWYDGYQFGNTQIYCPWDVMNYCDLLRVQPDAKPQDYWSNTSSNDVIRRLVSYTGNVTVKRELERLVEGEAVFQKVCNDLTYRDLYRSVTNIWSVLLMTGYLTQRGKPDGDALRLVIPNMEIRGIFTEQIMKYFYETVKKDGTAVGQFCEALKNGDAAGVEDQFGRYLKKAVSIRDTFVKKPMKENYYHGILMGLLAYKDTWAVFSNRESGDGYSDILVEMEEEEIGVVIEVKYADDGDLEKGCIKALEQIEKNGYAQQLVDDGMRTVMKYGVACYKKRCRVRFAEC